MSIRPTYSTMGQSSPASVASGGYCRYKGDKPEKKTPQGEPLPQNARATSAKQKRMAEYTRLRLEDVPKEQAAEHVGIRPSTMHYYEREFVAQHPQEVRDAR